MRIRLISPFKKVLCPYCYKEFHLSDMMYRDLTDPGNKVVAPEILKTFFPVEAENPDFVDKKIENPKVDDPEFPWFWRKLRKNPLIRRCFVVRTNGVRFGKDAKEYWGCCPRCGLRIPREWSDGDIADRTISIVGLRGSGKSCYLTELIEELNLRQNDVGYALTPLRTVTLGGADMIKYVDSAQLFDERYASEKRNNYVPGTDVYNQNPLLRIPLIYRIMKDGKKVDLCLYDPAGEDVGDLTAFHNNYYYATCASGVIFIVDPCVFPALRNYGRYDVDETRSPIDALYRLYSESGKLVNNQITVPCAVVVSKFDRFKKEEDFQDLLEAPVVLHRDGYNRTYYKSIHQKMNNFFAKRNVPLCAKSLGNILSNFHLFAVSALGGEAIDVVDKATGERRPQYPPDPKKFGIAAPIFWLLYKFGVFPEGKNA